MNLDNIDRWDPVIEDGHATYDKHETGALILVTDLPRILALNIPSVYAMSEEIKRNVLFALKPSIRDTAAIEAAKAVHALMMIQNAPTP